MTAPSKVCDETRSDPDHTSAVSFTRTARRLSPSGCIVTSRSAWAWRSAYSSGLRRPAPSTALQETEGQQSLSCQTMLPVHSGLSERKYSTARRIARAWLSDIAQCQSSIVSGTGKCGTSPMVSLTFPSAAFWWASTPGDSGVNGSSVTAVRSVDHAGGACQPNSATNRGRWSR
jgi:hypothetical protein